MTDLPTNAETGTAAAALRAELRGPVVLGTSAVAVFFLVGGLWAATAPISGAVISNGVVSPEGSRQTVQHLEGGIIRQLKVREGQKVLAGETLVELEGVRAQAEADARNSRLRALAAAEARLRAERSGAKTIAFDHPVLADRSNPDTREAIDAQLNQFRARRENMASRVAVLDQRVVQLEKQISGFHRQIESVERQRSLIAEEVEGVEQLHQQGLERKARLLGLQRTQAQLLGNRGELDARIAQAEEAIGETRLRIINLKTEHLEAVDTEITKVIAERVQLEKELSSTLDRLRRTDIVAPISGTVLNLRFKTPGGVIGPGQPIVDIVPADGALVIDARVRPGDIDDVRPGQDAHIVFSSFAQRNLGRIEGQVERISPDALEDSRTGESYYSARVTVDRQDIAHVAPTVDLYPGMPAEVFIATEERTLLEYLLQPFLQSLGRSFRET